MYDLIIIGGGPAGYVAAIKASQKNLKVACIEKRGALGGTCLNVGCIPSKALLQSTHKYHEVSHGLEEHGIEVKDVKFHLSKMMERKNNVVSSLNKGIEGLFSKNKVTYIKGAAKFISSKELEVQKNDGTTEKVSAKNIIIATGSDVISIPGIEVDETSILSSTGALELKAIPSSLAVIGGGYIGLEMSSIWARLGTKVTVIEYADKMLPNMDQDVSKELQKILSKLGVEFKTSTKVHSAKTTKNGVELSIETNGTKETVTFEKTLVCVGRKPNTTGLCLENVGIKLDERSRIEVNHNFETNVSGVYAVGDVIKGPMLAHKAEEEAIAAVEIICGEKPHINYDAIPGVIYTYPEVASVGKSEQELKEKGIPYKIGKFPFLANSRARANGDAEGFVKIMTHQDTDRILGAYIIGPNAGELIQEIVLGMEYSASAEDIARTSHGHPGLSEAVKEAALAAWFKAIHI